MTAEHWDVNEDEVTKQRHRVDCHVGESLVNDHPATAGGLVQKVVMLDKRKISRNSKTDRHIQLLPILSSWLRRSCRRSSGQYRRCSLLEQASEIGVALIEDWSFWIAIWRLDSRLASGDGGRKRPASAVGSGNPIGSRQKTWRLRKEILLSTQPQNDGPGKDGDGHDGASIKKEGTSVVGSNFSHGPRG